jgi:hypothetical protein
MYNVRSLAQASGLVVVLYVLAGSVNAQDATRINLEGGWVVLPVAEYRTLRERAYPATRPPDPPPVEAALTRIEYDLTVTGDSAVGQTRLTVDVLKEGWVKVPIPQGLLVREARIENRPISLVEETKGRPGATPYVLLSRSGRQTVVLEIAMPVTARGGIESLTLPPSQAPVQRTTLALRAPEIDLNVTGGFVAERTQSGQTGQNAQGVRFVVYGRAGERLGLAWGRQRAVPGHQPLRIRSRTVEVVGLAEDSAQITAEITADVMQGQTDSIRISVPSGLSINLVSGALVADWQVQNDVLEIPLLEPVDRTVSVTVTAEARLPREGQVPIPLMRLEGAERETGGVAVEVLGAGEVSQQALHGLDPADPADLGDGVAARRSPALVAFRFQPADSHAPRTLTLTVARYTSQAVMLANVEEARYRTLLTEDGKSLVDVRYAVRNTERSFLTIALPPGATFWSASVDGRPARPGRSADGALLVPMLKNRSDAGSVVVLEVVYFARAAAWGPGSSVAIKLPALDLPVSRTGVTVFHSPKYRLALDQAAGGGFRVQPYEDPQTAALRSLPATLALADGRREVKNAKETGGEPKDAEVGDLVARFQRSTAAGRVAGILPVTMTFPALGPSLYLASELTPGGTPPEMHFSLKATNR